MQERTFASLKHLYIPPARLRVIPNSTFASGGYGVVMLAVLDGKTKVAVKELRPVGDDDERARLACVRSLDHL